MFPVWSSEGGQLEQRVVPAESHTVWGMRIGSPPLVPGQSICSLSLGGVWLCVGVAPGRGMHLDALEAKWQEMGLTSVPT